MMIIKLSIVLIVTISTFVEISPNYSLNLLTALERWADTVHTCTMVSHLEAEQG